MGLWARAPHRAPGSGWREPNMSRLGGISPAPQSLFPRNFPLRAFASEGISPRIATDADLPALVAIEQACCNWNAAQVAEELLRPTAIVLVAELDSQVAGWLVAWRVPPDELQILQVAVAPACRRRGVARALLTAMVREHSGGVAVVLLEVRASNEGAIKLYEDIGFVSVGRRRRFYSDGEDAILMNLNLECCAAPL